MNPTPYWWLNLLIAVLIALVVIWLIVFVVRELDDETAEATFVSVRALFGAALGG